MQCRPNTQLRLDLTEPNANGVIVVADILLVEVGWKHTLFSFRDKGTLARGFTVEIGYDNSVQLWLDPGSGSWENPVGTTEKLNPSKYNLFFT